MRTVIGILILLLGCVLPTNASIRFLLPELQHYTHGDEPITGNIDVLVSLLPEDIPREISSVNIAFATSSTAVEFGVPTNPSERSLFDTSPLDFSPSPQVAFVGIDLIDVSRDSTPLFDQAVIVRVPYTIAAGETGDFDLDFRIPFNELAGNDYQPLPIDLSDTGLISVVVANRADYNLDGLVDLADYSTWSQAYGISGPHNADGNRDNLVNAADYTIWRDAYARSQSLGIVAAQVPEPSAMSLLVFGLMTILGKRNLNPNFIYKV